MEIRLGEIAKLIGGRVSGRDDVRIRGVSGIREAKEGDITFVSNRKYAKELANTKASAIIISEDMSEISTPSVSLLITNDPYYAFCRIISLFYKKKYRPIGVSDTAYIGKDVALGNDLSIYPFVTVSDSSIIGDRVVIYQGSYVGEGTEIGSDTIIYPNVTIREDVVIGKRVIIHSGTVIGSDGFGYAKHDGRYHKILQVGGVIVEDDVEIGANVAIDRAVMGKTIIKRGTKIDNLVQIGHNVSIGEDSVIVSQVGISGSVEIGDRATLAGQVGVAGHINIGDDVIVGGKSGVTRDIKNKSIVSGFPTIPHNKWLKAQILFSHLPEIKKSICFLEERIKKIEELLSETTCSE
ncbi:MAG: UDP-3-O-(3-hydroxymyristoyl)glucosamine N-acyltransferase [Nitrospirota bacterium]